MEICTLISMGFSRNVAEKALRKKGGNVEQAIDYLLSEQQQSQTEITNCTDKPSQESNKTNFDTKEESKIIISNFSQYDLSNGKSACTYISLTAVQILLPYVSTCQCITSDLISKCLFEGVEKYNTHHDGEVEHTSPEEVLVYYNNTIEWIDNKVMQGMLDTNNSEIGIQSLVSKQQLDDEYVAIVITKPPETILIFLPPHNTNGPHYILFDSHSRPNISGAYVKIHDTMGELIRSIQEIFPAVDLGDDSLNMMYNSFDLYLLRCIIKSE